MKRRSVPAWRAAAAGFLLLLCGGCQFLQNEFTSLDRAAPSVQRAGVCETQPW